MTFETAELLKLDREHVERVREAIERYDSKDRDGFSVVLKLALKHGVSRQQLCEEFGVSVGTVSRWHAGETSPTPITRRIIASRLAEMVSPVEIGLVPA